MSVTRSDRKSWQSPVLGLLGALVALMGTYVATWFSSGYRGPPTRGFSSGSVFHTRGVTLSGLSTLFPPLSSGGSYGFSTTWYDRAALVMTAGAAVLAIGAVLSLLGRQRRPAVIFGAIAMAFGSAVILFVAFKTGSPSWVSYGLYPVYFLRGPGRWVCVAGAACGLGGVAVSSMWRGPVGAQSPMVP